MQPKGNNLISRRVRKGKDWKDMTPQERRSAKKVWSVLIGVVVVLILLCVGCCFGGGAVGNLNAQEKTLTVCEFHDQTTRDDDGSMGHQYMVITNDGVYTMQDGILLSPFKWRTRTSDEFFNLETNKVYDFKTTGWRFGLRSSYPNLFMLKPRPDLQPATCPKR